MLKILNNPPSVINHFLYEMRHKGIQKDRAKFRNNLKRLGMSMAYELSKTLDYQVNTVSTPLGDTEVALLKAQPVIVGILRAASPFLQGFVEVFDRADIGFTGVLRTEDKDKIEANLKYMASSSLNGRQVIVVDPMLATGKSLMASIHTLLNNGVPSHIHIVAAVAAPEGIDYISQILKQEHTIWTAALDEKLDSNAYIVPGVGDAGDLCFGPKL